MLEVIDGTKGKLQPRKVSRDVFFWLQKINQEKNSETTVNVTYYEVQKLINILK